MVARFTLASALALCATAGAAIAAEPSKVPAKLDVRAESVGFYPYANTSAVAAQGGVTIRLGARTLRADRAVYDLPSDRIVLSGDVRAERPGQPALAGDAYAVDLAHDTGTLVRLEPVPRTFAVRGDDERTLVESPAPAGAFASLDLDGQRAYIRSRHAVIVPHGSMRMTPATFPSGAGVALTLPSYVYTLVQSGNISRQIGAGSTFDEPLPLFGNANSLAAAHVRYDQTNGTELAVDHHLVDSDKAYLVSSYLPFRGRRFDMTGFQQLKPGLTQSFSAYQTYGSGGINAGSYQLQSTQRRVTESLNANLSGPNNSLDFALSTNYREVAHFGYQIRSDFAYEHNFDGFPYVNDYKKMIGAYVSAPELHFRGTSFDAKYDYSVTGYDYPHEVTAGTFSLQASRSVNARVRLSAGVSITQNDNRYRDLATGTQALGLPSPDSVYTAADGTPFPGYFAYSGLNTYRQYSLGATINGRGDDTLNLYVQHDRDFPQFHGNGNPPLFASVYVTRRVLPTMRVSLGRSYSFGWGDRYLSPQWSFGISP